MLSPIEIQKMVSQMLPKLNPEELEENLIENPADHGSREDLLKYYGFTWVYNTEDAVKRHKHILWLIENHPSLPLTGSPAAIIFKRKEPESYLKAKNLWLDHAEKNPTDVTILKNAARFFTNNEKEIAIDLFKKCKKVDPQNDQVSTMLAMAYGLGSDSKKDHLLAMEELESTLDFIEGEGRFVILTHLVKTSYAAGRYEKSKDYALELLSQLDQFKKSYNYGNAIHRAHTVLGKLALKEGNISLAKEHLIKAGNTPGSPQLNSFGPNMSLAKELLVQGEVTTVLEYINLCEKFWTISLLKNLPKQWKEEIRKGNIPDFGGNLKY